ncbi:neurotrophin 1-like [Centruroides vittatus]|uniref:neurotrophin 1-like n=1 Tax=Centruroides vittatus TaxID=120091 RepID=UPI00350FF51A
MLKLVILSICLYFNYASHPYNNYNRGGRYRYKDAEQRPYPPQGYGYRQPPYYPKEPACAKNTTATYCLEDNEYPGYEIQNAIYKYYQEFQPLYAEVTQNTGNSVDNLKSLEEETYLCPSTTLYARPLRAKDVDGKWKIIVNVEKYYQTTRIESCMKANDPCPLVPTCYSSSCVQKSIYHRFVIYDPYDYYGNPFRIDIFRLDASCSCYVGAHTW